MKSQPQTIGIAIAVLGFLGACATSDGNDASSGGGGLACIPGDSKACACGFGQMGAQVCTSDGHGYGACTNCTGEGVGGAGGSGGATVACKPGDTMVCYSGKIGTNGIGPCHEGTTTCNAQGSAWGPCVGEVTPAFDDCTSPADEDCDGLAPSCTGTTLWAKRAGDAVFQAAKAVAIDASGNTVVAGTFQGTFDFGLGPFTSAGDDDIFIAKLGSTGNPLWIKTFGDVGNQRLSGVATDAQGNVLLTGDFEGSVDFGGGLLSALERDMFVAKLDPAGVHVFSKRFGADNEQIGLAIAADMAGDIIVTGNFVGGVHFGGVLLMSTSWDVFIVKLDSLGNHIWSHRYGDAPDGQFARAIAVDTAGNVVVTGHFAGSIDFGTGLLTSAGGVDVFLAKFDTNGKAVWVKRFGDIMDQEGHGVAVTPNGNVVLAGVMQGSSDFGGGALTSADANDAFVAAFGSGGLPIWSKRFGGVSNDSAATVVADGAGNIVVAGAFVTSIDFGGGPFVGIGDEDAFVAKLDPLGKHVWSRGFHALGYQGPGALAFFENGDVVVAGQFEQTVDFGTGPLSSGGGFDIFVARLAP